MQQATGECTQLKYRSAIYGLLYVLVSESKRLSFKYNISFSFFSPMKLKFLKLFTMLLNEAQSRASNFQAFVAGSKVIID